MGRRDLLAREVVGALISSYLAHGRLEVSVSLSYMYTSGLRFVFPINAHRHAIMNQSEARLHSRRSVHFRPSLHVSPIPSFRFSEGLVPRLVPVSQKISSPGKIVAATKFPRIYGRPSMTEIDS